MTTTRALDPSLWVDTEDGPRLQGGRCRSCGTTTFPQQQGCPKCTAPDSEACLLAARGTLWSWTVQGFPPKAPYLGSSDPYGVGYVELPGVIVETRLTTTSDLVIGMPVQLAIVPLATDPDGTEVLTFAFAPTGATA